MTEKEALVLLNMIPDMGPRRINQLIQLFGSAKKVINASPSNLCKVKGLGEETVRKFMYYKNRLDLKKEFLLLKTHNISLLSLQDEDYPKNLKNIYDPPPLLYVRGKILPQDINALAVVGARRASYYGLMCSERFSWKLASLGFTIVSGMARGIDSSSHRGALRAKGRTIAVLGSGLCKIYPPENKKLAEEISSSGAIISEFPLNTPPLAKNFPRRNRIISGLAKAVLVVEASRNSGALITADFALEQGREVFALPGKLDSPVSWGTHTLIKQGAKLVTDIQDILEDIPPQGLTEDSFSSSKEITALDKEERLIYEILSSEPKHIEMILQESNLSFKEVIEALTRLEIKGLIIQLPAKRYVKRILKNGIKK